MLIIVLIIIDYDFISYEFFLFIGSFGILKSVLNLVASLRRPFQYENEVVPWHRKIHFSQSISFLSAAWFIIGNSVFFNSSVM